MNSEAEPVSAADSSPVEPVDFVLLRADSVYFLLPSSQISAPEYVHNKLVVVEGTEGMGLFCEEHSDNTDMYMAISEQIRLLTQPPTDRTVATLVRTADGGDIRWCWNEIKPVQQQSIYLQPLSPVLMEPDTLISHFAEVDGHLAFLCDANKLLSHALAASGGVV